MRFIETELYGTCIVNLASHEDERDVFTHSIDFRLLPDLVPATMEAAR